MDMPGFRKALLQRFAENFRENYAHRIDSPEMLEESARMYAEMSVSTFLSDLQVCQDIVEDYLGMAVYHALWPMSTPSTRTPESQDL